MSIVILSSYLSLYAARFALIVASSSQCVAIKVGEFLKIFSKAVSLSTNIFPVDEPMKTLTPQTSRGLVFKTSSRSEEHTSELQSRENLVCRLLLEKKKT